MPPAAPSTVADISSVKSLVQSFGFKFITSTNIVGRGLRK